MTIAALLAAYRPGHSLGQAFYSDPGIFARDMEMLAGRWLCVGHVSELPAAGDWLTAELGRESAIVTHGPGGEIRALANVCRHRGSRICTAPHGHGPTLTCPYHGWTYRLDGQLRRADVDAERINVPANPNHYWRYRVHLKLETLLLATELNARLARLIKDSGR